MATGETETIVPTPPEGELPFRGQWVAPFILSPHEPHVVYHGMNYLFRSMNRGETWQRISPDLTFNDPEKYGDIPYQTLFSIAESPFQFGLLYVGTDDGRIWRTEDGGGEWTEINRGVPVKWVAELVASRHDRATVYMAQNGKRDDDFSAYLWRSTDYGDHWTSIVHNLPSGPVNVIKEDPKNPDLLYVGTDLGVYVSLDGGEEWFSLPGGGLPSSYYQDLVVQPEEDVLVVASHGRGLWAMDVRPIQALTPEVMRENVHLFDPDPAQVPQGFRDPGVTANIQYWVGRGAGEATVTIRDPQGTVVRELSGNGERGLQAVVWDLTTGSADAPFQGFRRRANRVGAGSYSVTVRVGQASDQGTLVVVQ
jgi:hypothetical protein